MNNAENTVTADCLFALEEALKIEGKAPEKILIAGMDSEFLKKAEPLLRGKPLCAENFTDDRIAPAAPFDLIIANIEADPLDNMAEYVPCYLSDSGGLAILAGIPDSEGNNILQLFERQGLSNAYGYKGLMRRNCLTLCLE